MGIPDGSDLLVANTGFSSEAKSIMFDLKGQAWILVAGK
jgi:hypothetical protein